MHLLYHEYVPQIHKMQSTFSWSLKTFLNKISEVAHVPPMCSSCDSQGLPIGKNHRIDSRSDSHNIQIWESISLIESYSKCVGFQGRIQDILKEGVPTLRVYRTLAPVETGGCLRGMCPLRSEEKLQFSKSIRKIWCILFAWGTHTKSGALSLQKIEGVHAGWAPL